MLQYLTKLPSDIFVAVDVSLIEVSSVSFFFGKGNKILIIIKENKKIIE